MARKRGGSWVANFGRSVAFGLGNAAMDNMTTVKSLKDNNEEFMKNVYETMKDIKNLQSTIIDKYYDSSEDAKEVKDALKDLKENGSKGFKNFLKNGTIGLSDEDREKNEMKAFGMEDMDFDLGDLDSGEDDLEKALAGVDEDEDLMTPMEKKTSDIGNAQLKAVNDNTRAEVAIGQIGRAHV